MSMSTFTPPEEKQFIYITDLDPLMQPKWYRFKKEELQQFLKLPPFITLPFPLMPYPGHMKPPLMYFGWKIDLETWFKIAHCRGFAAHDTQGMHFDDEEMPDDVDEDDWRPGDETEIHKYLSVSRLFEYFLRQKLGIRPSYYIQRLEETPERLAKRCMGFEGSQTMFVLHDNYHQYNHNGSLTPKELRELQKLMGLESEPPKWFPSKIFCWSRS
ncbi:hypothetical protein PHLCEN_2v7577 [Hermanssonia centrifuga]|uniref:Uncharacterized protein n=1 Tax=Hermanssonia centrifuga TaxID=98765 RepID=A0A2R6NW58_9APHY|nr:hypothetical protein PHLCEN_2v7577 [Hermanssonia centrifuga]